MSPDSAVIRFQEGASPDKIVHSFPTLKLSLVFGVRVSMARYLSSVVIATDDERVFNEARRFGAPGRA